MWKSLYEVVRTMVHLSEHVQEDREEIKEIRKDLRDLTLAVERLSAQVVHVSEREERERAMLDAAAGERPAAGRPGATGGRGGRGRLSASRPPR